MNSFQLVGNLIIKSLNHSNFHHAKSLKTFQKVNVKFVSKKKKPKDIKIQSLKDIETSAIYAKKLLQETFKSYLRKLLQIIYKFFNRFLNIKHFN